MCRYHAVAGGPATQAAVLVHAVLSAYNMLRHGARIPMLSLVIARAKELRRRHTLVREAVDGLVLA